MNDRAHVQFCDHGLTCCLCVTWKYVLPDTDFHVVGSTSLVALAAASVASELPVSSLLILPLLVFELAGYCEELVVLVLEFIKLSKLLLPVGFLSFIALFKKSLHLRRGIENADRERLMLAEHPKAW